MKRIIRNNILFLILFTIIWVVLAIVMLVYSKADIHLYINKFHNTLFDFFFRVTTFLGDGITPALLSVVFLFISFRKSFIIGGGAIVVGVFTQVLKRVFFADVMRPRAYFEEIAQLYFVPNVNVHTHFSFPSGHTTTAFCLFFVLAYLVKNRWLKTFCFVLALAAAYSRMYLSQHFLIDVYFGALLGIVSAFISILIFEKPRRLWLDKSLITIFRAK